MAWSRTDDPLADFYNWDAEQDDDTDWLKSRPICDYCLKPIEDDIKFDIDDGQFCEDCVRKLYGVRI